MSESISPADLLIDEQNPRISQPNVGQHRAIQALAQRQRRKLLMLARDIVNYGLNPSELSIVIPHEGDPKRYVVLEGNRRLAALRALENPELLVDAVKANVFKEMRKLSHAYQDNPVESVECLVVTNRAEANHWIELRHTGEREGAGIVRWGSDEVARFRARSGKREIHQQAGFSTAPRRPVARGEATCPNHELQTANRNPRSAIQTRGRGTQSHAASAC
jgi:hypothetical protein